MRSIKRTTSGAILLSAALFWYPELAPAQFTQQGPKLLSFGAVTPARLGTSVALSADGNTAIVGGPCDNALTPSSLCSRGAAAGAAWVFTRSGGVLWGEQAKLVGSSASSDAVQGTSVALSADGNTAIVGGPSDNGDAGATWVFTRSGGVWTQQGNKLVGNDAFGNAEQGSPSRCRLMATPPSWVAPVTFLGPVP